MRRLFNIVALSLALAISGAAPSAWAGSKKGAASKKGGSKTPTPSKEPAKLSDPLGDVGANGSKAGAGASGGAAPQRGPTRIDFDDRLIQGQTNRSGAVYLYDRKELQTKSMVKKRESFRQEILSTVYDTQ